MRLMEDLHVKMGVTPCILWMKSVTQFLRKQNAHVFLHRILHAPYMGQKELEGRKVPKMKQRYVNINILKEDVA